MTTAWLQDLEERVQEAAERLKELRSENEQLKAQVQELEGQLAAAEADDQSAAWTAEREEIRTRVEKLTDHLGELLQD